jgi:hypothetical protein
MPAYESKHYVDNIVAMQAYASYYWVVKQKAPHSAVTENGAKSSERGKPHAEPKMHCRPASRKRQAEMNVLPIRRRWQCSPARSRTRSTVLCSTAAPLSAQSNLLQGRSGC